MGRDFLKNTGEGLLNHAIIYFTKILLKAGIIIHILHDFMFSQDLFKAEMMG